MLVFNAIIAGLLGIGIVRRNKTIKMIAYNLSLIVIVIIIAGYAYLIWFRISQLSWLLTFIILN